MKKQPVPMGVQTVISEPVMIMVIGKVADQNTATKREKSLSLPMTINVIDADMIDTQKYYESTTMTVILTITFLKT